MASSLDYVKYVCEQMSGAGEITYKKMFGEYTVYCDDKILGLICDNQVFIKPTKAGERLIPDAIKKPPYEGAKPYIVLEDLDSREWLTEVIGAVCEELPVKKGR